MGLFGTIARAARAAFSGRAAATTAKAAKRATAGRNLFERTANRVRDYRAKGQPYKDIPGDVAEKLFYERTQKLWQGAPAGQRIERILEGLGVESLDEAKAIVYSDMLEQLEGKFTNKWYAMTEDEKYRHILSILVRR